MTIEYANAAELHADRFADTSNWFHEGVGEIVRLPEGGMRLHCFGSRQGGEGCMAFFRPTLPDGMAVEYGIVVHSHGGLVINFLGIRGRGGEDMIEDRDKLRPRTGVFADYVGDGSDLQSFHVSFSRFNDKGEHTGTSNWRRNPGLLLVGHGTDRVTEIGRRFHIRVTKDFCHCQMFVDGAFAHACIDRDSARFPVPDTGKFGFRLIGSDVKADIFDFRVYKIDSDKEVRKLRKAMGAET
jgi:hypothetical protein